MHHIARGLLVLLALFAAGVCGVSLETSLFDELAVESQPHDSGDQSAAAQPQFTFKTLDESDIDYPDLSECCPRNLAVENAVSDVPQCAAEPEVPSMSQEVRLVGGDEESQIEPCVCRCKTRCPRRLVRCRLR
jgi:hypothetical protein